MYLSLSSFFKSSKKHPTLSFEIKLMGFYNKFLLNYKLLKI